jgi:hypothetical protein
MEEGKRQKWESVLIRAYEKNWTLTQYCIATLSDRNPIAHSNALLSVNSLYNKPALMPSFTGDTQHIVVVIPTNTEVSDTLSIQMLLSVYSQRSIHSRLILKPLNAEFSRLVPSLMTQYDLSS